MYNPTKSLETISKAAANVPAYTQGGGGNTSVKYGDLMYIKASGFRLDEVSEKYGYVKVNYQPIVQYLEENTRENADTEIKNFVKAQIVGENTFLPSMETGFHAVLKQYVIHTHPIAVNNYMCSKEGNTFIEKQFADTDYCIIPYTNPGYSLSKAIANLGSHKPSIIFLQNHGLIVHADTEKEVIELHKQVTSKLETTDNNFAFSLNLIAANCFELNSGLLSVFFEDKTILTHTFFPDQAVVLGQNYCYSATKQAAIALNFIEETQQCYINASYKNALAIAENLIALASIIAFNANANTLLQPLPIKDVAYILGMDMEKYRQGLLG